MKLPYRRLLLPTLALAMGALGFYHVSHESQTTPPVPPPAMPAQTPYQNGIAASGIVEARSENIAIGAALPGLVLEVYVPSERVGAQVTAGQPLFRVDDRHLKTQLKVAEAQLAAAQARLVKLEMQPRPEELPPAWAKLLAAKVHTANMQDQYERGKRLVETSTLAEEEFAIRHKLYDAAVHQQARAQAEYDLLKAGAWKPDLDVAAAAVAEARAQVEHMKTDIARATVCAPVDGVVLQVNVRPGERVSDRDAKALVVLGDISHYHVRIDIDERDIARFRPGVVAKAYPRGATSHEMTLRFVRVEPFVVPKKSLTGDNTERVDTRVLQVIYAVERGGHPVYVGQQLDVFIDSAARAAEAK